MTYIDETVQRKGKEAEKAGRGHLENFPALKHGEGVQPFCGCPIIPEFPQPAADPASQQKSVEAAGHAFGEIADKGWKAETMIEGIEEQEKSDPDEREKKRGEVVGHE